MKYKKYFRKTSLKQKGVGEFFLEEVKLKKPRNFLEIGVFHGVTARNVCELLYKIHKDNFKYVGLDLFEENDLMELKNSIVKNYNSNVYFTSTVNKKGLDKMCSDVWDHLRDIYND